MISHAGAAFSVYGSPLKLGRGVTKDKTVARLEGAVASEDSFPRPML